MRSLDRRYRQRRVRDGRRTVPVHGIREDRGQYYRCHWCGWILDVERDADAFGDMGAEKGNLQGRTLKTPSPTPYNYDSVLSIDAGRNDFVLAELDAAGDQKPVFYLYTYTPAGCPLCGTRANRT